METIRGFRHGRREDSSVRRLGGLGTAVVVSLGSAAFLAELPAGEARARGGPGPVNVVHQAYVTIKAERGKIVRTYVDALFKIADDCVAEKLAEPGRRIADRILKTVEPPESRWKVAAADSRTGRSDGREGLDPGDQDAEVVRKPASPEEEAYLASVRERVAKLREALGVGDEPAPPAPEGSGGASEDATPTEVVQGRAKATPTAKDAGGARSKKAPAGAAKAGSRDVLTPLDKKIQSRERKALDDLVRSAERLILQCVAQGFPAHGYELLLWAIEMDPDNAGLRRMAGQYRVKDRQGTLHWYSRYEKAKAEQGYVLNPDYGWVTPAEIEGLEAGKLYDKGRWRPREIVEAERQKWENRWTHETEHFEISTNASLRDAVAFGREVERLYAFFFRVFIDFYSTGRAEDDARIVFGGGKEPGRKKLRLHYYRSREQFIEEFRKTPAPGRQGDPDSDRTAGFYSGETGIAYFYRGPDGPDLSVIYHEVTHQIFGETYGPVACPPTWLDEAFAVFLENPTVRGERLVAGARPPPGLENSTRRDINGFLRTCGTDAGFHGRGGTENYEMAGAVAHFFLLYKGGIYRQGFMRYAREAYRNEEYEVPTRVQKLYDLLRVDPRQLQSDWEAFGESPDLFDF